MIARIWRGTVSVSPTRTPITYLQGTGLKRICLHRRQPRSACVALCEGRWLEVLILTFWDSWDAIKAFAGPDYEKAVYYPEDKRFLLEMRPFVEHYSSWTAQHDCEQSQRNSCKGHSLAQNFWLPGSEHPLRYGKQAMAGS